MSAPHCHDMVPESIIFSRVHITLFLGPYRQRKSRGCAQYLTRDRNRGPAVPKSRVLVRNTMNAENLRGMIVVVSGILKQLPHSSSTMVRPNECRLLKLISPVRIWDHLFFLNTKVVLSIYNTVFPSPIPFISLYIKYRRWSWRR